MHCYGFKYFKKKITGSWFALLGHALPGFTLCGIRVTQVHWRWSLAGGGVAALPLKRSSSVDRSSAKAQREDNSEERWKHDGAKVWSEVGHP
ncbi:hypothetical protein ATANTOWER_011480 [Ataeniobius toweri]|uniref:Secreted protein n=1 Tax=Ataeniobius toweri TaxID=208326 RepID=A0ABU7BS84_9TELE|nr:hypothetical protein [Ataeniobius toweri]